MHPLRRDRRGHLPPHACGLRAALLLCALLLGAGRATASGGSAGPGELGGSGLALRAAKILTVARTGPAVVDHGVLLVRDGKIEAVGRARELAIPPGYTVLDVGEQWLMPGLIELHNHIGSGSAFTVNDINDMVLLTNPDLRASPGVRPDNPLLRRGVAGGVTTALYIPGSGTNMGGQGVLFKLGMPTYEAMLVREPGSLKLAQAGNPEGFTVGVTRTFMNWNTRNTFQRGIKYAKAWEAYERGEGPEPEKDIQWEIFRALRKNEAQVSTHTQAYQVVLMTCTMVARDLGLPVFIDHGCFDAYRVAGIAEQLGVPAILGPRNLQAPAAPRMDTDGRILGQAAGHQERGHTRIGFNTDCVDNGVFITPPQEELSLQAALGARYGLTRFNMETIRGLTLVPAETVALGDRLGSLEPGKDADVLAVTGDIADPRTAVERVWTNGRLIYDTASEPRRW
jgi:imidazolonepropionase-like amidohydrolase